MKVGGDEGTRSSRGHARFISPTRYGREFWTEEPTQRLADSEQSMPEPMSSKHSGCQIGRYGAASAPATCKPSRVRPRGPAPPPHQQASATDTNIEMPCCHVHRMDGLSVIAAVNSWYRSAQAVVDPVFHPCRSIAANATLHDRLQILQTLP